MAEMGKGNKPLSSWKEIAAYLGCDQRTCIRWETKHGLPVHRPGSDQARSHVFAYKDELDRWLKKKSGAPETQDEESPKPRISRLTKFVFGSLLLAGFSLLAFLFLIHVPSQQRSSLLTQPADFKIRGSELVVVNSKGQELWSYDTHLDALEDESIIRNHFQVKQLSPSGHRILPTIIIDDVDEDGAKEVFFVPLTHNVSHICDLICFSFTGHIKWRFGPERSIRCGVTPYKNDFLFYGIGLLPDHSYGNNARIVVFGQHYPEFPTFIDVLTGQGRQVGEYWNAGRILDYSLADVNDDGRQELVLVGTNNEYKKGCLVALDPADMRGGSPQTGAYHVQGLEPGSEIRYLLFPRTQLDELEYFPHENVFRIEGLPSGRLMVVAEYSTIVYELSHRLDMNG